MEAVRAALGIEIVVDSVSSNLNAADIARWASTEQGFLNQLGAPEVAQRRGLERGVGALPSLKTLFVSEALRSVPRTTADGCFAVSLACVHVSRSTAPPPPSQQHAHHQHAHTCTTPRSSSARPRKTFAGVTAGKF